MGFQVAFDSFHLTGICLGTLEMSILQNFDLFFFCLSPFWKYFILEISIKWKRGCSDM